MTQTTPVTAAQRLAEVEEKIDEMDAKLDKLIDFCNKAVAAAERVGEHPMLASLFPKKK